jgi:uncharacterized protein
MTPVIPDAARARVMADLARIERDESVRILFAVESGSRAWGFPSPDSDFDARFVYVRKPDWYLSLEPGRDVIELPIDGDFDVNGWDIRKALLLIMKPNPVLIEWLQSPIRYLWDETLCARLRDFAGRTAYARACLHHYLHLGERLWSEFVEGRSEVNLKKYLYILRPSLCLQWIREERGMPPMSLPELMQGLDLAEDFRAQVADLLARKAKSSEVGNGPRVAALDDYIGRELAWGRASPVEPRTDPSVRAEAEELFRSIVKGGG